MLTFQRRMQLKKKDDLAYEFKYFQKAFENINYSRCVLVS